MGEKDSSADVQASFFELKSEFDETKSNWFAEAFSVDFDPYF